MLAGWAFTTFVVAVADDDCGGVQRQEDGEQDEDRRRRQRAEVLLGPRDPLVDLHRQRGELPEQCRVERNVGERPHQEERRGLAEPAREAEDRPRRDARRRGGEHLAPDDLPLRGAERVGALTDRVGNGPDRLARGDDHRREHEQREDHRPGQENPPEAEPTDEEGEAEDAVDDRGHRRQVLDVHLEQPVVPALAVRVLLEVERSSDPERDGEGEQQDAEKDRRDDRRLGAGDLRVGRRRLEEEHRVNPPVALEQDLREQRPEGQEADQQRRDEEELEQPAGPEAARPAAPKL